MNPLRALKDWTARRRFRAEMRSLIGQGGGVAPSAPVLSGTFVTPETALTLVAVYAAVNVISRDIAIMPRNVYRKLKSGGREVALDQPAHNLIRWQADDEVDALRFFQTLMSHVLTRGNGFAEIVRSTFDGSPQALHVLHPGTTKPKRTPSGQLYYELDGKDDNRLPPENVLHFAGMGFDGLRGYSPITIARQTIGLGLAAEQFGASFFGNSAIPKGVLKHPKRLTEAAAKNLRGTFYSVHQGPQNAHHLAVLEEGMDWVNTQISPEDSQFLQTREFQVKDIARLYSVPPSKIGDYTNSHLRNIEEANLDYITTTLHGWVAMIEYQLTLKLLTPKDRRKFEISFDMSALSRGNTAARTTFYQSMRNMGAISADEIRDREGLNPIGEVAGGNLFIVQGQYLPLDQVSKIAGDLGGKSVDSDPSNDSSRSLARRFNPNHDPTNGEFSDGSGGGAIIGEITHSDRAATREALATAKGHGMDVALKKGPPANPREAKAATTAEAKGNGQLAVAVTQTPKIVHSTDGHTAEYRFGDPGVGGGGIYARTYPDPRKSGAGRWIAETKTSEFDASKQSYRTSHQALRAARAFMREQQANEVERSVKVVKSLSKTVAAVLDQYNFKGSVFKSWKVRFKVLTKASQ